MWTIILLTASNVFMTFAWYAHVKYKDHPVWKPMWAAILISWAIALAEYCLQVPANRLGKEAFSFSQLKTIQEVITLAVFCGFSVLFLKEPIRWNHLVGFGLIAAGAFFLFRRLPV
jgi:uncharacterized protein (DUF486 family)